jgi:hypothetical protein
VWDGDKRRTHNGKGRTSEKSSQKATYEDSLQVLGYRNGNLKYCKDKDTHKQRSLPSVQFRQGSEDNGAKSEAQDEQTDS